MARPPGCGAALSFPQAQPSLEERTGGPGRGRPHQGLWSEASVGGPAAAGSGWHLPRTEGCASRCHRLPRSRGHTGGNHGQGCPTPETLRQPQAPNPRRHHHGHPQPWACFLQTHRSLGPCLGQCRSSGPEAAGLRSAHPDQCPDTAETGTGGHSRGNLVLTPAGPSLPAADLPRASEVSLEGSDVEKTGGQGAGFPRGSRGPAAELPALPVTSQFWHRHPWSWTHRAVGATGDVSGRTRAAGVLTLG